MNSKTDPNQAVYNQSEIVNEYAAAKQLTKPEAAILELVKRLPDKNAVLDIGIGGGRTTPFFSAVFKSYVGIDYAENMVSCCQRRFNLPNAVFQHGDARDLRRFPNDSFDFVLFSFNGIDCVNPVDRSMVLNEIARVLKPGGSFAFSTHNLYSLQKLKRFNFRKHPYWLLKEIQRCFRLRKQLDSYGDWGNTDFIMINDGDQDFKFEYFYIKPEKQITMLTKLGFKGIRVFSGDTAEEMNHETVFAERREGWMYFFCRIEK